jgi:DNA modification methylase
MKQSTPALTVEMWPIERPIPYVRNPRQLTDATVGKVAGSIKEFGWRQPIVVDSEDVIVVGHTRLLAARRLGMGHVPVHVAKDLTPAQAKAYRLADNRTSQETEWDPELLGLELEELAGLEFDLDLTGFDPDELAAWTRDTSTGLTDPDDAPELPVEPISQQGDLWLLGDHRLLCGDSTNADDVARVMDGKRAVLMATDPPYLVDYDGGNHPQTWANRGKVGKDTAKHWDAYTDHENATDFYRAFLAIALKAALVDNSAVYQWFGAMRADVILEAWRAEGLLPHQMLIWLKTRTVLTHSHFMWNYEPMMYGWLEGHMPSLKPPAAARAIWEIASGGDDTCGVHPTQKPVETIRRPIAYHTKPGDRIYEPFAGSGTAIIAAQEAGRSCCAIELGPAFVDVAVLRWQAFAGEEARHADDGRSFAEIAAERV